MAMEDSLVERARNGDQAAFSELVREHRSQMLGWANQVVHDSALAEDVVQEALLSTLKHIGRLANPDKFLPWLRTIVRNQALMAIRGQPRKRELAVGIELLEDQTRTESYAGAMDDPQLAAIGNLALNQVEKLLGRLGDRERAVVRAYGMAGLSIQEVADELGMKTGAVYTALSRSRAKLAEARFEDEIDRYLGARRRGRKPKQAVVRHVRYYGSAAAYNTMASTMMLSIGASGYHNISMKEIMGATGLAFRIQATPDLGISGAYAFDWGITARSGFERLGFVGAVLGGSGVRLDQPDELIESMDMIVSCLEQGIPSIAWNVSNAEFGLITGYDDQERSWSVMDTSSSGKKLPYTKLGRLYADSEWFVAAPLRRHSTWITQPVSGIFKDAAMHIRGGIPGDTVMAKKIPSVHGKEAYRLWIRSFAGQTAVSPLSVAYQAAVVAEARAYAARYLDSLAESLPIRVLYSSTVPAIRHAAGLYSKIGEAWAELARLFPLPYSADPAAPGPADRSVRLLEQALTAELEAAEALEEAADLLERKG
ncbi:RNA polymerase sigma factor [Paenibacillus sp. HJGM_3]|uniref:RNA polymerase sigma factor n=1 Tax=Paenibacillus sp. HJGM_3 TaxID=3379816 RepID=UPI00385DCD0C